MYDVFLERCGKVYIMHEAAAAQQVAVSAPPIAGIQPIFCQVSCMPRVSYNCLCVTVGFR